MLIGKIVVFGVVIDFLEEEKVWGGGIYKLFNVFVVFLYGFFRGMYYLFFG